MTAKRLGIVIAQAALGVNLLRFILVFLTADNIAVPVPVEAAMLAITGFATGIVLTGGGIYTIHVLTLPIQRAGVTRLFLATSWYLLLAFTIILLSPMLVLTIQHSPLAQVMPTTTSQYFWAVTAVISVEILAGAGVASSVLLNTASSNEVQEQEQTMATRLAQALGTRVERILLGENNPSNPGSPNQAIRSAEAATADAQGAPGRPVEGKAQTSSVKAVTATEQVLDQGSTAINGRQPNHMGGRTKKQQTLEAMLALYQADPTLSQSEVARRLGRSVKTIRSYLQELVADNQLMRTEQGYAPVPAPLEAQPEPGD